MSHSVRDEVGPSLFRHILREIIDVDGTPAVLGVERGGEARLWLAEQSAYDVWQAQQRFKSAPMQVQPAPRIDSSVVA